MDDSQSAEHAEKNVKNKLPKSIRKINQSFSAYYKRKKTENENYQPNERFARQSAHATIVIAILTLITVCVGISQGIIYNRQLDVMRDQLKEMHDSGVDTHSLAIAASQQAAAAVQQAGTMDKQLDVFQRQLDTMLYQQRSNVRFRTALAPTFVSDLGKIAWNVAYVNIGMHDIEHASMKIQMSIGDAPFFLSVSNSNVFLPIGDEYFSTAVSKDTYTLDQFQELMKGDGKIKIYVTMEYVDFLGANASVQRCWGHRTTGAIASISPADCLK